MKRTLVKLIPVLAIAFQLTSGATTTAAASACTSEWSGLGDGVTWSDSQNWADEDAPSADDHVCIDQLSSAGAILINGGGIVAIASVQSVRSIEIRDATDLRFTDDAATSVLADVNVLNGSTISGSGTQRISAGSSFDWHSSSFGGTGRLVVSVGAEMNLDFTSGPTWSSIVDERIIENHGSAEIRLHQGFAYAGSPDFCARVLSPRLENYGELSFSGALASCEGVGWSVPRGFVENHGTVDFDGDSQIQWPTVNDGEFAVSAGNLKLAIGGAGRESKGRFSAVPGATSLAFVRMGTRGPSQIGAGAELDGTVLVDGGLQIAGEVSADGYMGIRPGGAVSGDGTLYQSGELDLDGGQIVGTGTQVIRSGGLLRLQYGSLRDGGETRVSLGARMILGGGESWPDAIRAANGRRLVNEGEANFPEGDPWTVKSVEADPNWPAPLFVNKGSLTLDGSVWLGLPVKNLGTTESYVSEPDQNAAFSDLENDGTVVSVSGSLVVFGGSTGESSGEFIARPGSGTLYFAGTNEHRFADGAAIRGEIVTGDWVTFRLNGSLSVSGMGDGRWLSVVGSGELVPLDGVRIDASFSEDAGVRIRNNVTVQVVVGLYGGGTSTIEPGGRLRGEVCVGDTHRLVNFADLSWDPDDGPPASIQPCDAGSRPEFVNYGTLEPGGFPFLPGFTNLGDEFHARLVNHGLFALNYSSVHSRWSLINDGVIELGRGITPIPEFASTRDGVIRVSVRSGWPNTPVQSASLEVINNASVAGRLEVDCSQVAAFPAGAEIVPLTANHIYGRIDNLQIVPDPGCPELAADLGESELRLAPREEPETPTTSAARGSTFAFFASAADPQGVPQGPDSSDAVSSASYKPKIALDVDKPPTRIVPGDLVEYRAEVSHDGGTLSLEGLMESTPVASQATIGSYLAYVERRRVDTGEWEPIAGMARATNGITPSYLPPTQTGMTLALEPVPDEDVQFSTGSDHVLLTRAAPGTSAKWRYEASVPVGQSLAKKLLDPSQTSDLRLVYQIESVFADPECDPAGVAGAIRRTRFGRLLGSTSGAVENVKVDVGLPDGTTREIGSVDEPGLSSLGLNDRVELRVPYEQPSVEAKADGEADGAYLARLAELDGSILPVTLSGSGVIDPAFA